jgi:CheY-like chemotaxis protein
MAVILVVEDNLVNQKLIQAILRSMGHLSDVAQNGAIALEMLAKREYQLVLMDLMMPVMDGYEATRRIRADANLRHLPVVAVTADTLSGGRKRALAAGCNAFLPKPYTKSQLLEVVAQHLAESNDRVRL